LIPQEALCRKTGERHQLAWFSDSHKYNVKGSLVNRYLLIAVVLLLAACGTAPPMNQSEMAKYRGVSIEQFMAEHYSWRNTRRLAASRREYNNFLDSVTELTNFCEINGGVATFTPGKPPEPIEGPSGIRCALANDNDSWEVRFVFHLSAGRNTRDSYMASVESKAARASSSSWKRADEKMRQAQEDAVIARNVEAAERAAVRVQLAAKNEAFRRNLRVGDRTVSYGYRGLVVEIRQPLAQVQFENVEPAMRWVPIEELYAP
jgi:hypothetical protein